MSKVGEMADPAWECPKCGRVFNNENQWHSCDLRGLDAHFHHRPGELRGAFDEIVRRLKPKCEFEVEAVKTMILLRSKSSFASIKVEKASLKIGFTTREVLDHPRLLDSVVYSASSVESFIRISTPDEVDDELATWLIDACEMSS